MEKQPSLDLLLMKVSDMIEMIQNHKGPISQNLTPQILDELEKLEKAMSFITKMSEAAFESAGLDPKALKAEIMASDHTSSKNMQLLKRSEAISKDARTLQNAIAKAIERRDGKTKEKNSSQKRIKRQGIKERKKLFKPIGGDKSWIPL